MDKSNHHDIANRGRPGRDEGFILLAIMFTVIPLIVIAGAAAGLLTGNSGRLTDRVAGSKAFQAAESGLDWVIYQASIGGITADGAKTLDLASGMQARVVYELLGLDGADNDGDGSVDEGDEDVIRVHSQGRYRLARRSVVGYVGRALAPPAVPGSVYIQGVPNVNADGLSLITGHNSNLDGSPGDATFDLPGITTPLVQYTNLLNVIDDAEAPHVTGVGGTPSTGTGFINVDYLIDAYKARASRVLPGATYTQAQWGDSSVADMQITYVDHDVKLDGPTTGAGILVVNGDLRAAGEFRWDGLVLVKGQAQFAGQADIRGGLMLGTGSGYLRVTGQANLNYSKEALDMVVAQLSLGAVLFNGWQRVANGN